MQSLQVASLTHHDIVAPPRVPCSLVRGACASSMEHDVAEHGAVTRLRIRLSLLQRTTQGAHVRVRAPDIVLSGLQQSVGRTFCTFTPASQYSPESILPLKAAGYLSLSQIYTRQQCCCIS